MTEESPFQDPRPLFADVADHRLENDDRGFLDVRQPESYDLLPALVGLPLSLRQLTQPEVTDWWESLREDNVRVACLRGVRIDEDSYGSRCDYCRCPHPDDAPRWFCLDCRKEMCDLCRGETDETVAAANGAQNYAKRKEALQKCQTEHRLRELVFPTLACDECDRPIVDAEFFKRGEEDFCLGCSAGVQPPLDESERRRQKPCFTYVDASGYGSMLDWLPVVAPAEEDDSSSMVFVNANPDSPLRGKVCYAQWDNHGRAGFWDAWSSWDEFLAWIAQPSVVLRKKPDYECDTCEEFAPDDVWHHTQTRTDLCAACHSALPLDQRAPYELKNYASDLSPPAQRFARFPLDFVLLWIGKSGYHG